MNKEIDDKNNTSKKNLEPEKNRYIRKIVAVIATIFLLSLGTYIYFNQTNTSEYVQIKKKKYNYSMLINSWNKQVQNFTEDKKFLLKRDNTSEMIDQLDEFMGSFCEPAISNSTQYNNFLVENKIKECIYFNDSMNEDKIRKLLKRITQKSAMADIVEKVLMMNSFKFFESMKSQN